MIEKSLYENYQIDFSEEISPDSGDYLFVFNENRQLYLDKDKGLPENLDDFKVNFCLFIGMYKGMKAFAVNACDDDSFYDLREVYEFDHDLYHIASKAVLVNDYPRIAPAIIVAISNDDMLLMAKHSYHDNIRYALIAGFVEPGEAIEEAVHREVLEEVGIKIKNLKYMRSQSWPFPNSLMLGFTAEYESGDIKVDGDEILKAKWFKKDEIIRYGSDISISDWLIQNFIDSH